MVYNRGMTIRAKFDGRVFVPEQPVDMQVGDQVLVSSIEPVEKAGNGQKASLKRLLSEAKRFGPMADSPGDGAAQHDHHLYGTSKRNDA
jgi:hypothetical protein